jgi:CHAT domain-containing protein/tetratricopeptide (TPR) repeat protein
VGGILQDRVREALRLAEAHPRESVALAQVIAAQARAEKDFSSLSAAERALGLAALHLADPDTALRHLRTAIRVGGRAGSAELENEARMSLAFALNVRGRAAQALLEIGTAVAGLHGVARARAQAQRGAILTQAGRHDEALPCYRAALPVLRRAGDDVWVQRMLYNRSVSRGYRQEFTAAEMDLREAAQLCIRLDLDLSLAFVRQNLGWIEGLRGNVPAALHNLDMAEASFRAHGSPVGELLIDRCQLLLSVRLIPEARQAAEAAVRELAHERRETGLPEARVLLAQSALLDQQPGLALEQATRAAREFTGQHRLRWATLARFLVLQSRLADSGAGVSLPQLERVAAELATATWPVMAVEARMLAAQLALNRGWRTRASQQLAQVARHRQRGPALLRARGWHAEALARHAQGYDRSAMAAARTALRVLDDHRAGLGATDLRAFTSGHRTEVAQLGLRIAVQSGRASQVLEWAEQGRASHLLIRPARPPADPVLAQSLAELRATASEIFRLRGAGASTGGLERRQVVLEREIRDRIRHRPGDLTSQAAGPVPVGDLAQALGAAALLEFVDLDGTLHAVVIADGRVRLRPLGDTAQARDLINRARFAMHRLTRRSTSPASAVAARALLTEVASWLDELLLRPLADAVGDRPLVVVPTGPLQAMPWSILPSCYGRPVTVAPSATLWYTSRPTAGAPGRPVVAAGPGLPGAEAEAVAVAAIHRVTETTGPAATVKAVTAALDGAKLAHLSAHGRIHSQNPLFSSLMLADGPLTVYDLEHLRRAPELVVLAACDVGRPSVSAGDELLGLGATFLALGTRQVTASVVPVADAETTPVMKAFHRLLAAGRPAENALACAQLELGRSEPAVMASAAGFVSIGARSPSATAA